MRSVLYAIALGAAYAAGRLLLQARLTPKRNARRRPAATLTAFALIAMISLVQFVYPPTLPALRRDAAAVAAGEPWRLATSLFVQDGGFAGTAFNLVSLLLVGGVAERLLGTWRWLAVFVPGAMLAEIIALRWQPIGAGNSVANFSLAAAVCVCCLTSRPGRERLAAALLSVGASATLLAMHDIHGAAFFIGGILAAPFAGRSGITSPATTDPAA